MRIFTNESIWDAENQDWCEVYFIDRRRVNIDEYSEQLKVEESVTDEDLELEEDETSDVCDECKNCVGCDEHCGRGNHDEENYECEDNELVECECPICEAEREVQEQECFCEECNRDYEKEIIEEYLERIFGDACPECIVGNLIQSLYKFKEIGRQSVKQEMREFLED